MKTLKSRKINKKVLAVIFLFFISYLVYITYISLPQKDLSFTVNACLNNEIDTKSSWERSVFGDYSIIIQSTTNLDVSQEPVLANYLINDDNLTLRYVIPMCKENCSGSPKCIRQLTSIIENIEKRDYKINVIYDRPSIIQTVIWKLTCKNNNSPCDI